MKQMFLACIRGVTMAWTTSQIAVGLIGFLHFIFMTAELLPWKCPLIMSLVLRKWPRQLDLSSEDKFLVSMIVHNAGIYNGIVAAGLFASALITPEPFQIQIVLLAGGVVAGIFGAFTLSKGTAIQAICGALAIAAVIYF
jgi:uncharacterized membrane protein